MSKELEVSGKCSADVSQVHVGDGSGKPTSEVFSRAMPCSNDTGGILGYLIFLSIL